MATEISWFMNMSGFRCLQKPSGATWQTVGCMNLPLRKEPQDRDTDYRVARIQVVGKVLRMEQVN